jgi:hypothetical protein
MWWCLTGSIASHGRRHRRHPLSVTAAYNGRPLSVTAAVIAAALFL